MALSLPDRARTWLAIRPPPPANKNRTFPDTYVPLPLGLPKATHCLRLPLPLEIIRRDPDISGRAGLSSSQFANARSASLARRRPRASLPHCAVRVLSRTPGPALVKIRSTSRGTAPRCARTRARAPHSPAAAATCGCGPHMRRRSRKFQMPLFPSPPRESRRYLGPVEITKEISDGDRSPTQTRCHTGPATPDPRRGSLLAATPAAPVAPRGLPLYRRPHTLAWRRLLCGASRSPPRGPVCGHDPRPPRPGKRRFVRFIHTPGALPALGPPPASPLPVR